jgi:hypothetical protein
MGTGISYRDGQGGHDIAEGKTAPELISADEHGLTRMGSRSLSWDRQDGVTRGAVNHGGAECAEGGWRRIGNGLDGLGGRCGQAGRGGRCHSRARGNPGDDVVNTFSERSRCETPGLDSPVKRGNDIVLHPLRHFTWRQPIAGWRYPIDTPRPEPEFRIR